MAGAGAREAEDYYSVLGCDPSSSEEQIMTEYRIRAKESHPDKMGETEDFQVCFFLERRLSETSNRYFFSFLVDTRS